MAIIKLHSSVNHTLAGREIIWLRYSYYKTPIDFSAQRIWPSDFFLQQSFLHYIARKVSWISWICFLIELYKLVALWMVDVIQHNYILLYSLLMHILHFIELKLQQMLIERFYWKPCKTVIRSILMLIYISIYFKSIKKLVRSNQQLCAWSIVLYSLI